MTKECSKNGNGSNAPWWSKSAWVLGPVAAIAIALVAQNAGFLKSPLREDHSEIIDTQKEGNYLLRSMCIIQATKEGMDASNLCNPPPNYRTSQYDDIMRSNLFIKPALANDDLR